MLNIPDDPIIRSIERTGFPPWIDQDYEETEDEEENEDEYAPNR